MATPHPARDLLIRDQEQLRALARGLLRDPHAAEDVVQDAWMIAARSDRAVNPGGWLRTVTRNVALRQMRASRRRRAREEVAARPEAEGPAVDRLAAIELRRALLDAIEALREPYRSTIIARYLEEQMPSDIARAQAVPVKTVKTRLSRGLEQLRAQLDAKQGSRRAWAVPLTGLARFDVPAGAGTAGGVAVLGTFALAVRIGFAAALLAALGSGVWFVLDGDNVPPPAETASEPSDAPPPGAAPGLAGHATADAAGEGPGDRSPGSAASRAGVPPPAHASGVVRSAGAASRRMDIVGRVVDPSGAGVAGIHVDISSITLAGGDVTEADGRFKIHGAAVTNGVVELQFAEVPPTYLMPRAERAIAGAEPIVVTLQPALTITGRVVAPKGAAYESLSLHTQHPSARGRTWSRRHALASDGRFEIGGLRADERVRITCLDHREQRFGQLAPTVVPSAQAGMRDLEIRMGVGRILEGTAFEASGAPYAKKNVMLISRDHPLLGGVAGRTDDAGRFRFSGLAAGVYYVGLVKKADILHTKFLRTAVTVPSPPMELRSGPMPELAVRLRAPATDPELDLEGFRVQPASRGGAWHLDGFTEETDRTGVARLGVVRGASYDLFISRDGSPWYAHARGVSADAADLQIVLRRGRPIEGRVLDVTGKPVAGEGGRVTLVVGAFGPSTKIRSDGTFVLPFVPPGRHTLRAQAAFSTLSAWESDVEAGRTDVEIRIR